MRKEKMGIRRMVAEVREERAEGVELVGRRVAVNGGGDW